MANFSDYRCLIVDREPFMRRLLREMLRFVGIVEVELAGDGSQALMMINESPFDVMVTELDLPGMSGAELINRIRRSVHVFDNAIPIIGYTATITPGLVVGARDAGIHEIMVKPFPAAVLAKRLEAALVNPRPFVRSGAYVGPCRRRKAKPDFNGPYRREADRLAAEARRRAALEAQAAAAKAAEEARLRAEEESRRREEELARAARVAAAAAEAPRPVPADPGAMTQEELAKSLRSGKDR